MKKVIYDCDNTMGMSNRDIDDGLALMYLLERNDVDLLGVTCTYGNDSVDNVYEKTEHLLKDINRQDIQLIKGNSNRYVMKDYVELSFEKENSKYDYEHINKASKFIVDMVNKYPNEISILATGSMQNIYDAWCIDENLPDKINEIIVMGGTTDDLHFGDKIMNELNFTVCSDGAFTVLGNMKNLSILTGNNCMKSNFGVEDLELAKNIVQKNGKNRFLIDKIQKWMSEFKNMYNYDDIVLWDVIAAIYMMEKELFEEKYYINKTSIDDIKTGRLSLEISHKTENTINLPEIKESKSISEHLIDIIFK